MSMITSAGASVRSPPTRNARGDDDDDSEGGGGGRMGTQEQMDLPSPLPKPDGITSPLMMREGGKQIAYTAPTPINVQEGGLPAHCCPVEGCTHTTRRLTDYVKHYRGKHDSVRSYGARFRQRFTLDDAIGSLAFAPT
jgi:hypothetical protein